MGNRAGNSWDIYGCYSVFTPNRFECGEILPFRLQVLRSDLDRLWKKLGKLGKKYDEDWFALFGVRCCMGCLDVVCAPTVSLLSSRNLMTDGRAWSAFVHKFLLISMNSHGIPNYTMRTGHKERH